MRIDLVLEIIWFFSNFNEKGSWIAMFQKTLKLKKASCFMQNLSQPKFYLKKLQFYNQA